jgi:hypothetical protein
VNVKRLREREVDKALQQIFPHPLSERLTYLLLDLLEYLDCQKGYTCESLGGSGRKGNCFTTKELQSTDKTAVCVDILPL